MIEKVSQINFIQYNLHRIGGFRRIYFATILIELREMAGSIYTSTLRYA